jgi:hypothetical protein
VRGRGSGQNVVAFVFLSYSCHTISVRSESLASLLEGYYANTQRQNIMTMKSDETEIP